MKSFLARVALLAICVNVTARAADMPVKAAPVPLPPYNWSGFYLGANLGGAWTSVVESRDWQKSEQHGSYGDLSAPLNPH
jgi:opacity protein-like surface antigen